MVVSQNIIIMKNNHSTDYREGLQLRATPSLVHLIESLICACVVFVFIVPSCIRQDINRLFSSRVKFTPPQTTPSLILLTSCYTVLNMCDITCITLRSMSGYHVSGSTAHSTYGKAVHLCLY